VIREHERARLKRLLASCRRAVEARCAAGAVT
jgi:hypothetical protein